MASLSQTSYVAETHLTRAINRPKQYYFGKTNTLDAYTTSWKNLYSPLEILMDYLFDSRLADAVIRLSGKGEGIGLYA